MTLNEFIWKYNGKKVDYDGAYGAQCVDLFRQYAKDVCGIKEKLEPCSTSGGAKDLYLDYPKMPKLNTYFTRSAKKMVVGDIAVWGGTKDNPYGHVAIIIGQLKRDLVVFEQDGYKQDGAKINIRSCDNLLGVLRSRSAVV